MKMRNIKRSRVYITTYPETTLVEGYNSGIPTIFITVLIFLNDIQNLTF